MSEKVVELNTGNRTLVAKVSAEGRSFEITAVQHPDGDFAEVKGLETGAVVKIPAKMLPVISECLIAINKIKSK